MNELFFELIQVALGVRGCLSRTPNDMEWKALHDMAKKQSLVGICFAGVQQLATSTGSATGQRQEPPEMLYLTWMGMAAKIQQRNEVVNRQCAELQVRLAADGLQSCILKGQGVAQLYDGNLRGLRQSGDIDVWVNASEKGIIRWASKEGISDAPNYLHVGVSCFEDTDVELHFRPSYLRNPFADKRLKRWFKDCASMQMNNNVAIGSDCIIIAPTLDFNVVYLLLHAFRHLLGEGIGLRQLMDLYFAVCQFMKEGKPAKREEVNELLRSFNIDGFTSEVMWVLGEVFGMSRSLMISEPNEKGGKYLLSEIIKGGNFGHYDERLMGGSRIESSWKQTARNLKQTKYYFNEALWTIPWRVIVKIKYFNNKKV